ncbi:protein OCTOPUS-like [Pistacia vera]|uniref:protein OCTOPUS-like n=1 Tax=Pistacia vera TaxID=55513 RepID=UPI001263E170|nr:protein OCTOPUS-like [Pistacia vera]XP_031255231.1 protein OCTOPUS-like [Pistacia vera]
MTLQPQQTHHRYSTCHRHPTTKPITGFCATCLCERLSSIDSSATATPTSSTSPRLRRTKSYSSSDPNAASAFGSASEPRRKSCDVGPRNTLFNLFHVDDQFKNKKIYGPTSVGPALKEEEEGEEIKVCDALSEDENEGELKSMKEFIDLELERKKSHVSGFWETASVFSKKLLKWKQKQLQRKNKKQSTEEDNNNNNKGTERPTAETETQSEIGLYGYFGRRSCDTDPRLSVDNNVRYSFEEPRASWDGYLIGKAYPRLITPMAVVEEKGSSGNEGDKDSPGGSEQTRDYYGESLNIHRRRRSFDRCNSGKRTSFVDVDEVKSISNAKVSPETVGLFHGAKLLVTEKELRDSNWYSIKDYRAECVESDSKNVGYVDGGVGQKGFNFKNSLRRRNVWNMWGLIQKRSESKCGDEGNVHRVVDGALAESWQKIKRVANGEPNGTVSEKLIRSYSVSARNSLTVDGVEAKDNGGRRRDEILLQRNRSSAFSPNNLDNGLLRFYLTPVRSYRRSKSGRNRVKNSQSMTMNGL